MNRALIAAGALAFDGEVDVAGGDDSSSASITRGSPVRAPGAGWQLLVGEPRQVDVIDACDPILAGANRGREQQRRHVDEPPRRLWSRALLFARGHMVDHDPARLFPSLAEGRFFPRVHQVDHLPHTQRQRVNQHLVGGVFRLRLASCHGTPPIVTLNIDYSEPGSSAAKRDQFSGDVQNGRLRHGSRARSAWHANQQKSGCRSFDESATT